MCFLWKAQLLGRWLQEISVADLCFFRQARDVRTGLVQGQVQVRSQGSGRGSGQVQGLVRSRVNPDSGTGQI